jgi:hypothetical protein
MDDGFLGTIEQRAVPMHPLARASRSSKTRIRGFLARCLGKPHAIPYSTRTSNTSGAS